MKNINGIIAVIGMIFSLSAFGGPLEDRFHSLDSDLSGNVEAKINVLLKCYGEPSTFKIDKETKVTEECQYYTQLPGRRICNKKLKIETNTYFAESKSLFCKIIDNGDKINCLPKKEIVEPEKTEK